jgi:hypothetical protein
MRTLIDGMTAGILGAITVAGWFLMLDVARGQSFATPALLGATLMHGAVDARLVHVTLTLVIEYSVIHVTAFAAFGLVAAWLISAAERAGIDGRSIDTIRLLRGLFPTYDRCREPGRS